MLRNAYQKGCEAAFAKFALDPPTQVDAFMANVEHGKDVPLDSATDQPGNAPGNIHENPPAPILPQDPAAALGQPAGAL